MSDHISTAASRLHFAVAVFELDGDVALVPIGADSDESLMQSVIAKGYVFRATITVQSGVPSVHCEDGLEAAFALGRAGQPFAEMLGVRLKKLQQEALLGTAPPSTAAREN